MFEGIKKKLSEVKVDKQTVTKAFRVLIFVAAVTFPSLYVYELFTVDMNMAWYEGVLAVLVSVGVMLWMLNQIVEKPHTLVRAVAGVGLTITGAVVLFMSALRIARMAEAKGLGFITIPPELSNMGGVSIGVLGIIALVSVLMVILVERTVDRMRFRSVASAYAFVFIFVIGWVIVIASSIASFFYGVNELHINPVLAFVVAMLYEGLFVAAFFNVSKAGRENEQVDFLLWGALLAILGTFIGAIGLETLSKLGGRPIAITNLFGFDLQNLGANLYVSALFVAGAVTWLTHILCGRINGTILDNLRRLFATIAQVIREVGIWIAEVVRGLIGFVKNLFGKGGPETANMHRDGGRGPKAPK